MAQYTITDTIEMNGKTYCKEQSFVDYFEANKARGEKLERAYRNDREALVWTSPNGYDLGIYYTSDEEYNEYIIL